MLAAIVYIYRKIQERHFMKSIAGLLENPNEGLMKFPGLSSIKRNKGSVTLTSGPRPGKVLCPVASSSNRQE